MINVTFTQKKYSRDLYVRLHEDELNQLEFVHLYSEALPRPTFHPICGYTEWSGLHLDTTISLAWDWALDNDGVPHFSRPEMLRSNIMLVSAKGDDLGLEATAAKCELAIEHLPWRLEVLTSLRNKLH